MHLSLLRVAHLPQRGAAAGNPITERAAGTPAAKSTAAPWSLKDAERPWASLSLVLPCRRPQLMRHSLTAGTVQASRPLPTPSLPAQRSWGRSEDLASTRLLLQGSICGRHPSHLGGNRSFRPRTHTSPRHDPSEALTRAGPGALSVLLAGALWATPRGLPAPGGCQKGRTEKSRPAAYQRPSRHPSALNPFRDICQQNTSNLGGSRGR